MQTDWSVGNMGCQDFYKGSTQKSKKGGSGPEGSFGDVLAEKEQEGPGTGCKDPADISAFLRGRMDEILEKVKNGETEPRFQIGSQSFTEKEWDRLLERFDSAEDDIKEDMEEEQEKRGKREEKLKEIATLYQIGQKWDNR